MCITSIAGRAFPYELQSVLTRSGKMSSTILNYKRDPMSIVKGPLIRLLLTVAHSEVSHAPNPQMSIAVLVVERSKVPFFL